MFKSRLGSRTKLPATFRSYQQIPPIIKEIQKNPASVQGLKMNARWWGRFFVSVALATTLAMLVYTLTEVVKVWKSDHDCHQNVYLPLWLGVNWPFQRKLSYSAYKDHLDPSLLSIDPRALEKSVPARVLDCLFRLPIVRETYGIPLRVVSSDDFEVWVEPQYPTVHGLKISISKTDGNVDVGLDWRIRLLNWDVVDCVQGTIWRLGGLLPSPGNTPDYGSGRVHEIHEKNPLIKPDFRVLISGHLTVSSKEHGGVVLYIGAVDPDHMQLGGGTRLRSVELSMSDSGRLIRYKILESD